MKRLSIPVIAESLNRSFGLDDSSARRSATETQSNKHSHVYHLTEKCPQARLIFRSQQRRWFVDVVTLHIVNADFAQLVQHRLILDEFRDGLYAHHMTDVVD